MESNVFYTLLKDDGTEDGVGDNWTLEEAIGHVRRCAWEVNGIKYTLVEHNIEEDSLQPTRSKRGRSKSSKRSSGE